MVKTLEDAKKKLEQAKALVMQLRAREKQEERKLDARRKIILGGLMIAEAKSNSEAKARLQARLAALPERDKKAFDGWHV